MRSTSALGSAHLLTQPTCLICTLCSLQLCWDLCSQPLLVLPPLSSKSRHAEVRCVYPCRETPTQAYQHSNLASRVMMVDEDPPWYLSCFLASFPWCLQMCLFPGYVAVLASTFCVVIYSYFSSSVSLFSLCLLPLVYQPLHSGCSAVSAGGSSSLSGLPRSVSVLGMVS